MYPHRIRLRGPWDCEPLHRAQPGDMEPGSEPLPPKRRMTLPCRWGAGGLGDFAGRVRFQRRFGWPGRIDAHERVWLTFAGVEGSAEVRLNGQFLGRHGGINEPFEFDVTSLLQFRNDLRVEVEAPSGDGGLWGEVALEVRGLDFLRAVRWWFVREGETTRLHVRGEVVGHNEQPLELYALLEGATVIYARVEADPMGKPFHLTSADLPRQGEPASIQAIRIELIHGASVWYAIEGAIPP